MQTTRISPDYRDYLLEHSERWIMQHITRPIQGFDQKRNNDGTLFSWSQQLSATWLQALAVAVYFIDRGKSKEEVIEILEAFR